MRDVSQQGSRLARACALLLILLAPTLARADGAEDVAKQHNARAKQLFTLGMFRQAAGEYRAAYDTKPLPAYLFNLAQCYKQLPTDQDLRQAVFHFKMYLIKAPDSPMREGIDREIAKLEKELERRRQVAAVTTPVYKRWWFWTLIGVAAAGATVGTVMAVRPGDATVTKGTAPGGAVQLELR